MKNYYLVLLLLFAFSLSNCSKNDDGDDNDNDPNSQEWSSYCSGLQGGDFDLQLGGENWSSNCGFASYIEVSTDDYVQKITTIYAYNHDLTFSDKTDIEVIVIQRVEITSSGQTNTIDFAYYYEGFYDYAEIINNPNYTPEEIRIFFSDNYYDGELNITSQTATTISGNLNFDLIEEEEGEETLTLSGTFTANIEE